MTLLPHIRRALPGAALWRDDVAWLACHFPAAIAEEIAASGSTSARRADHAQAEDIATTVQQLCTMSNTACLLFAEVEQQRAGYFLGVVRENVGEQPRWIGYVNGLYVLPAFRRGGVARALAQSGLEWFRTQSLPVAELYVAQHNDAGKKFWAEFGFAPSAVILTAALK